MERYFCESCCSRYNQSGDCEKCEDEPLLDLTDPDVIQFLQDADDGRVRKQAAKFTVGLAIVCVPLLIGFGTFSNWLGLIVYAGAVTGGTKTLLKKFPPQRKSPAESSLNFAPKPLAA